MRVAVVAEYYPGPHDPGHGIWAHRQALATRDAGADPHVAVLRRPLPPLSVLRQPGRLVGWAQRERTGRGGSAHDGLDVRDVHYLSPPRPLAYADWGEWAARPLARALERLHAEAPIALVHAHYAIPGARAALPFADRHGLPVVTSVHGADVLDTARRSARGRRKVAEALRSSAAVLCNSAGTRDLVAELGVGDGLRVVHLGAEVVSDPPPKRGEPTVCTVGFLVERKRHADVLHAVAQARGAMPGLRYVVVGDGPERGRLEALAAQLGLADAVEFTGTLEPSEALRVLASCHVMAMPSVGEAFGVAYVEALAAGVPAIGCAGEAGPEEIAALGEGMVRVPPRRPEALATAIVATLEPAEQARLSHAARATAAAHFTWRACGEATVAAYQDVL